MQYIYIYEYHVYIYNISCMYMYLHYIYMYISYTFSMYYMVLPERDMHPVKKMPNLPSVSPRKKGVLKRILNHG